MTQQRVLTSADLEPASGSFTPPPDQAADLVADLTAAGLPVTTGEALDLLVADLTAAGLPVTTGEALDLLAAERAGSLKEVSEDGRKVKILDLSQFDLSGVNTWEDIAAAWGEEVMDASDTLGDGFELLRGKRSKDRLLDTPFIVADFRFVDGDYGEFVTVAVVTKANERLRFNDGSTGIRDQLRQFEARHGKRGGLVVRHGLVRSDYQIEDAEGKAVEASTYYFSTSA